MKLILKESLQASLRSALLIIKLIVPLYILADILLYLDLLKHVSFLFEPVTSFLDLPSEAAMAIAAGILLNLYAAIAFAAPLGLTPYQWTILAVFLGVCHNMIIECAIMKKLGISYAYSIILRLVMAFITVLPVLFMPTSFFGPEIQQASIDHRLYDSFLQMLQGSLVNSMILTVKIIVLVSMIIFVMDWIKSTKFIQKYTEKINTSFSIIVGQLLGITYGAGILIREANDGHLSRNDTFFVATFLMISHAIIEDTFLFVIFGANYWLIIGVRLTIAIIVSFTVLRLMTRISSSNRHVEN